MPLNRDNRDSAYFVSDLHLTTLDDERGQFFLNWLKSLSADQCTHLFLVGDIFDLWLAHHSYFITTYEPVLREIKRLKAAGVAIHYFEGNHDLYLEEFFGKKLGVIVHPGPAQFELAGHLVRVEHGDQMDPEDHGYRFLRWFLRTPVMKSIALSLPNAVVVRLGQKLSVTSRHYTSEVKTVSRDTAIEKMRQHARQLLESKQSDFDLLVHGHTHVIDDFQWSHSGKPRRAINLGSWLNEGQILHLSASNTNLVPLYWGSQSK